MNLIDMHCDTLWQLLDLKGEGNLCENDCSVSIPAMRKAGTLAQFFACFTYVKDPEGNGREKDRECGGETDRERGSETDRECGGETDGERGSKTDGEHAGESDREHGVKDAYERGYRHVREMITFMEKQYLLFPDDIAPAYSYDDIRKNESENKISAILSIEEGGILNNRIERLDELYKNGIRLMTLMWNYENCLGYPNSRDRLLMKKGLKPFGMEVIERMGELGMIADVSHASDGTFRDILQCAKGPVIASHSNCRALCRHPRNLTDEMIRALADQGGVAGLNFYGPFLGNNKESRLDDMAAHMIHMIAAGGSEFPAVGTDFDGFDGMTHMDVPDVSYMEKLWETLKRKGVTESQLDKIWSKNALRVISAIKSQ